MIKAGADERGAMPATLPGGDAQNPRVRCLPQISWDAWGKTFQDRNLVFLFQQHLKSGRQSNFFRMDSPEREDG